MSMALSLGFDMIWPISDMAPMAAAWEGNNELDGCNNRESYEIPS